MILAIFHCEFIGNSLTLSCILQLELSVLASGVCEKILEILETKRTAIGEKKMMK
jgi:hypothetical protein